MKPQHAILARRLYWIAASINIRPGHNYYFYVRSVNTVGKSAFVEAVGRASDDAEGYLDFFKGLITESHLGKELLEKVDLTEDNASRLEQFSKEWKDANDKWNAMWGVKIEQTKDGKHYVAGIGLSMEDTEEGKLSQFLVAANRIAFIDPANGNETPMFCGAGQPDIHERRVPEAPDGPHHYQRWKSTGIFPDIRRKADR
ncbi:Host specificity protein J [Escherichia coli]|uniref:Host specificity protein J n=1 Tax=Escherichia coli TaxID=562 RepID=A0A447XXD1_ECOLX|nr:Host specificity protein J [Escherichia coli]